MDFTSHKPASAVNSNPHENEEIPAPTEAPPPDPVRTPVTASAPTQLDDFLTASGLTEQDCPRWRVVNTAGLNAALGRDPESGKIPGPAVEIPFFDIEGGPIVESGVAFKRFRILTPAAGSPKYLARSGTGNHLFIPARFAEAYEHDASKILIITEGEKKAAAACSRGIPAVGLCGVQQWPDTSARDAAKAAAETSGTPVDRLSKETLIMPELLDLIDRIKPEKILVLFDADGCPVERKKTRISPDAYDVRFTSGKGGEIKTDAGKRHVLNRDVYNAGQTFAAAIRWQRPGTPVAAGYVPHAVKIDGRRTSLDRQGLDDFLLIENVEPVRDLIADMVMQAVAVAPEKVEAATKSEKIKDRTAELASKQGYVPLGIDANPKGTSYHVWSIAAEQVSSLSDAALMRATSIMSATGVEYAHATWPNIVVHKNERTGEVVSEVVGIKIFHAQTKIMSDCQQAGHWSTKNEWGAGVWSDGKGGLLVSSKKGVFKVAGDEIEPVDRVMDGPDGKVVFPRTIYGDVADEPASTEEARDFITSMHTAWNWSKPSDPALLTGWLLLQAYNAALTARPNLSLTGATSTGKTAFVDHVAAFLGPWTATIADATNMSAPYLRATLGPSVVTVVLDEAEPAKVGKISSGGRIGLSRDFVAEVVRALRSSYSMHRTLGGKRIGERDGAIVLTGGKGTADGGARDETLCASALICAISPPATDAADRNRMIAIELQPLTAVQQARGVLKLDKWLGARLFRRMWSRWAEYEEMLGVIEKQIDSQSPRERLTLASPIAALLVALDEAADGSMATELVRQVVADRCGKDSIDSPQADHEAVLNALMSLPINVEDGGKRDTLPLATCIAKAIAEGAGTRGRTGGKPGDALRLKGMTAKQDEEGQCWLFIAKGHLGFVDFAGGMSHADVFPTLRRTPGVVEAGQRGGADTRIKIDARKGGCVGIWLPIELDTIDEFGLSEEAQAVM